MPRAKSTFFRIAATKPTTNSGSDVPKATRETPIMDSGISNSAAIFINQVQSDGLKNEERLFILNHSLIEYCKRENMNCIDLAGKLDGKQNYWSDGMHTTALGSKVISETIIDDLISIIKKEKLF